MVWGHGLLILRPQYGESVPYKEGVEPHSLPFPQVIPLQSTMKRPWNMPYVLDAACLVVVGLNMPFAIYGYLLFGSQTQGQPSGIVPLPLVMSPLPRTGYVFENLPGSTLNDTVRLFLSLELTLTFPIVFKPASEVMEQIWHNFLMVRAH